MDSSQKCRAPRGSKLFVITVEGLELLRKAFDCAPTSWFVDDVNQCMVASGHIAVHRPALAGSMMHYSERCGREVQQDELDASKREGEFLRITCGIR